VWECQGVVVDDDGIRTATGCRRQTSPIAGTEMHGTHLPLRIWFLAASPKVIFGAFQQNQSCYAHRCGMLSAIDMPMFVGSMIVCPPCKNRRRKIK